VSVLSLLWLLAFCAWPHPLSAQTETHVQLRWQAPPGCSSRAEVMREIERRLGPDFHGSTHVIADVQVRGGDASSFAIDADIRTETSQQNRHLLAESCAAAGDAAALLIALALDPNQLALAEPAPVPAPPREPTPAPAAAEKSELDWRFGAGIGLESGVLPGLSGGPSVSAGLAYREFRAGLTGAYVLPRAGRSALAASDAAAEFDLLSLGLSACYLPRLVGWPLGPCVQARSARLGAVPRGVERPKEAAARVDSLAASLAAEFALATWCLLRPELGARANLRRPVFMVTGAGTVHQPDALGFFAELAAVLVLE
jgi:hypothetical protein